MPRNLTGDGLDEREIRVAGLRLRRSHRDEDGFARLGRLGKIRRKPNAAVAIAPHQLRQVILVNEGVAIAQRRHLTFIVVDAQDVVAHLGEAHGCHKAHVTGADHRNLICCLHVPDFLGIGFRSLDRL